MDLKQELYRRCHNIAEGSDGLEHLSCEKLNSNFENSNQTVLITLYGECSLPVSRVSDASRAGVGEISYCMLMIERKPLGKFSTEATGASERGYCCHHQLVHPRRRVEKSKHLQETYILLHLLSYDTNIFLATRPIGLSNTPDSTLRCPLHVLIEIQMRRLPIHGTMVTTQ